MKDYSKPVLHDSYKVHLHALQNLSKSWHFVLEFYPHNQNHQKSPAMVVSHATFPVYEYAIEAGIETLEIIGFNILSTTTIDAYEMLQDMQYNVKTVLYDGDTFKLESETIIEYENYINQFQQFPS